MLQYREQIDSISDAVTQPTIQGNEDVDLRERYLTDNATKSDTLLAGELGVSYATYLKWRKGKNSPKIDAQIHRMYDVPYEGKVVRKSASTTWVTISPTTQLTHLRNGFTIRADYISFTDMSLEILNSNYVTVRVNERGQMEFTPGEDIQAHKLKAASGTTVPRELRSKILCDWLREHGHETGSFNELKTQGSTLIFG